MKIYGKVLLAAAVVLMAVISGVYGTSLEGGIKASAGAESSVSGNFEAGNAGFTGLASSVGPVTLSVHYVYSGIDVVNGYINEYSVSCKPKDGGDVLPTNRVAIKETIDITNADLIGAYANAIKEDYPFKSSHVSIFVSGPTNAAFKGTLEADATDKNYQTILKGHAEGALQSLGVADDGTNRVSQEGHSMGAPIIADLKLDANTAKLSVSGSGTFYVDKNTEADVIQDAVNAAWDGDIIRVAPGLYKENIFVDKSVAIKGSGELWTIVDGCGKARVFNIGRDASGTLYPDAVVTLSGMTIRNGNAEDNPIPTLDPSSKIGGGIFNAGTLTLDRCIVTNNIVDGTNCIEGSGAGISNYGRQLILKRCIVSNNKAIGSTTYGGGIINWHDWGEELPIVNVVDSSIINNVAGGTHESGGGGIWNWGTTTITNSRIVGNKATDGAGIENSYSDCTLNVVGSNIHDNVASRRGGGISNYGTATIRYSMIHNNKAGIGGGIYWGGTGPTIMGSLIFGNTPNNIAHA